MRKTTTELFIQKAKQIHHEKYDYSLVNYDNAHKKILIICNICTKSFLQIPHNHLHGKGCPFCSKRIKLTLDEVIFRAQITHGENAYDYSKVQYEKLHSKVEIICNSCNNIFWQTFAHHINGTKCPKCSIKLRVEKSRLGKNEFLNRLSEEQNFLYDYSFCDFINFNTKINILCKKCDMYFLQSPEKHISGNGCPTCANCTQLTTDEFIQKANAVHNNLYDYGLVNYKNAHEKVCIKCLKCDIVFFQVARLHLRGSGCKKCCNSIHYSKAEIEWLNLLNVNLEFRQCKIIVCDKVFIVDAFDPCTNTIYEFFGDYWHGNPEKYKSENFNKKVKKTFGELYENTISRIKLFKEFEYNIIYVWENDWKNRNKI